MTDGGAAETETGKTAIIITNETIETSVENANTKAGAVLLMSAGKSAAVL